ncbi:hypothetical protein [Pararhizobium arenae]|uniref:hypothetical protein n=1 Tax=Pararhizobium arenae TaxID=1856850 RepID=UPI00117BCBD0|nr:hypothetical protein [Pararhizobium arenae]
MLIDRTSGLGPTAPAQDDLRTALVIAVEAAAAAGAPFTKTGASGLFEMRERLPVKLRGIAKGRLDALAGEALDRGEIVRAAARGEKTAKWLDVPVDSSLSASAISHPERLDSVPGTVPTHYWEWPFLWEWER